MITINSQLLEGLNAKQKEAVLHHTGSLLILAGAGSGKTSVLTRRLAKMVSSGINAASILAVTFTNKAAREMRERAFCLGGDSVAAAMVCTFHSFGARFLRREITAINRSTSFNILDSGEVKGLIKDCIRDMNLDTEIFKPDDILRLISFNKNLLREPDEVALNAENDWGATAADIYKLYQAKLIESNLVDFDDLLLLPVKILRRFPELLASYRQQYNYIMVDEYQDTNHTQYTLIKMLAEKHHNVMVVGDIDQAIYSWRGANFRNILNFNKDFPEAKVIRLEQNYRSTGNILKAANSLIEFNIERVPKALWTDDISGEKVYIHENETDEAEADFIGDYLLRCQQDNMPLEAVAVLYRTNAQSRALEAALVRRGLPYHITGGKRFYDRKEIKDILAYLKLLINPSDIMSFKRIINNPRRGIGEKAEKAFLDMAQHEQIPILDFLKSKKWRNHFRNITEKGFNILCDIFSFLEQKYLTESASNLIILAYEITGYKDMLEQEVAKKQSSIDEDRIENVFQLVAAAEDFYNRTGQLSLKEFLDSTALLSGGEEDILTEGKVCLSTLHGSKGLEWPVVFITGMEEETFPHSMALPKPQAIEEERRLCYVGFTRARERLILNYARIRRSGCVLFEKKPSRFLNEIPDVILQKI